MAIIYPTEIVSFDGKESRNIFYNGRYPREAWMEVDGLLQCVWRKGTGAYNSKNGWDGDPCYVDDKGRVYDSEKQLYGSILTLETYDRDPKNVYATNISRFGNSTLLGLYDSNKKISIEHPDPDIKVSGNNYYDCYLFPASDIYIFRADSSLTSTGYKNIYFVTDHNFKKFYGMSPNDFTDSYERLEGYEFNNSYSVNPERKQNFVICDNQFLYQFKLDWWIYLDNPSDNTGWRPEYTEYTIFTPKRNNGLVKFTKKRTVKISSGDKIGYQNKKYYNYSSDFKIPSASYYDAPKGYSNYFSFSKCYVSRKKVEEDVIPQDIKDSLYGGVLYDYIYEYLYSVHELNTGSTIKKHKFEWSKKYIEGGINEGWIDGDNFINPLYEYKNRKELLINYLLGSDYIIAKDGMMFNYLENKIIGYKSTTNELMQKVNVEYEKENIIIFGKSINKLKMIKDPYIFSEKLLKDYGYTKYLFCDDGKYYFLVTLTNKNNSEILDEGSGIYYTDDFEHFKLKRDLSNKGFSLPILGKDGGKIIINRAYDLIDLLEYPRYYNLKSDDVKKCIFTDNKFLSNGNETYTVKEFPNNIENEQYYQGYVYIDNLFLEESDGNYFVMFNKKFEESYVGDLYNHEFQDTDAIVNISIETMLNGYDPNMIVEKNKEEEENVEDEL